MTEERLTKKERRELAKQKKLEEKNKEQNTEKTKQGMLWLIGLAVFAFLGWQVYQFLSDPLPEQVVFPIEVSQTDQIKGNPDAKVVLLEYSDFQCPACKAYQPLVNQVAEEMGEDILMVFRHFPLTTIHQNAFSAALAAEAAGKQEMFWEMNELLFERQEAWSQERNIDDIFIGYAEELDLEVERFTNDYNSGVVRAKVEGDIMSGNQLGVNSTPTFFLNGRRLQNIRTYQDFVNAINNELGQ